jgi:hypothetical protein
MVNSIAPPPPAGSAIGVHPTPLVVRHPAGDWLLPCVEMPTAHAVVAFNAEMLITALPLFTSLYTRAQELAATAWLAPRSALTPQASANQRFHVLVGPTMFARSRA